MGKFWTFFSYVLLKKNCWQIFIKFTVFSFLFYLCRITVVFLWWFSRNEEVILKFSWKKKIKICNDNNRIFWWGFEPTPLQKPHSQIACTKITLPNKSPHYFHSLSCSLNRVFLSRSYRPHNKWKKQKKQSRGNTVKNFRLKLKIKNWKSFEKLNIYWHSLNVSISIWNLRFEWENIYSTWFFVISVFYLKND
jgi:hypothetical protein